MRWQLLPASGFTRWGDSWWGAIKSLILPAISLALVQAAILTRYVRSAVLDVMREDYIRTARAKGMTLRQALRRHGVRNAAIPVVTVLGLQLSSLFVGAVVIENVFALPGLGKLLLDSIGNREIIMIQDIIMFLVRRHAGDQPRSSTSCTWSSIPACARARDEGAAQRQPRDRRDPRRVRGAAGGGVVLLDAVLGDQGERRRSARPDGMAARARHRPLRPRHALARSWSAPA